MPLCSQHRRRVDRSQDQLTEARKEGNAWKIAKKLMARCSEHPLRGEVLCSDTSLHLEYVTLGKSCMVLTLPSFPIVESVNLRVDGKTDVIRRLETL